MKLLILFFLLLFNVSGSAQYIDIPGEITRNLEKKAIENYKKESDNTSKSYKKALMLTNVAELGARLKISKIEKLINPKNELEYRLICNSYLNPVKKNKCKKRVTYLLSAHKLVYETYSISSTSNMRRGVAEQIQEKYITISNLLLIELEKIKMKSEKGFSLEEIVKN